MALSGTTSGTTRQIQPRLPKHKRRDISFADAFNIADDLNKRIRPRRFAIDSSARKAHDAACPRGNSVIAKRNNTCLRADRLSSASECLLIGRRATAHQGRARVNNVNMPDEAAQHRIKAEACRRLADLAEDADRRAMWDERAEYWDRLAAKAKKSPQRQKPSER